jgi:hypothetical protein
MGIDAPLVAIDASIVDASIVDGKSGTVDATID